MSDIKSELIAAIDVVDYIKSNGYPDWDGNEQTKLECPLAAIRHENGDDSSSSLSINPHTGAFNCFGCGWKGTSILGFATDAQFDGNFNKCLAILYAKHIRSTVDEDAVDNWHNRLTRQPLLMQRIYATRGWSEDTIKLFKIGWDKEEKRTVIPITNLEGYCIDIRMHDTLYRAKLVSGHRIPAKGTSNSRTGDWFPLSPTINPFTKNEVWLLEGEPDVIMATQDGINCVTLTGGAGAWKALDHERLRVLQGKDVIICLDNDKAGQEAARVLSEHLTAVGVHSLKNVKVPQGKDVTDYFLKHGGSAQSLKQYATGTDYLIKPTKRNVLTMPLSETSQAKHIGKYVSTNVIISGKAEAPQAIPSRLRLTCGSAELCAHCPCKDTGAGEHHVSTEDPHVLDWLYVRDYSTKVKEELRLGKSCKLHAEVEDWQNLEQVTLIPALSTSRNQDEGAYTTRRGYFIGHGIESNQTYTLLAMPTVHPKTKDSVLLISKADGTYDSVDSFSLTAPEFAQLKELFSDDPATIINDVCKMMAYNHTHIYGRGDVHAAVDIVFHSPRNFTFGGVAVPKGSMELLIFGDTRCGKGQVAEGLTSFYDLGQVVSGENASFMGLCGGAQKAGDNFQLSWGAIPINHGRLVVIDEFSGLSDDVLGRLSRVRSEGVAEINKGGINTRTRANTRLIWIANPRQGREVNSYPTGVSAIMDLIGANEDVARFDLALVVKKGEVDIAVINRQQQQQITSKYTKENLRKVVLWAWSRKNEHIVFTREATEKILHSANELAEMYSATIPLIQGENARFKVAKIAAAIALRTFSTEDGVFCKVTERHAELAVRLIQSFYSKESMGYRQFSDIETGTKSLIDVHLLDEFFRTWDKHKWQQIIDGLLTAEKFGVREIQDWCDVDAQIAKKWAGLFVRCQATKQLAGGLYFKKASFIQYLKKLKKAGKDDKHQSSN